MVKNTNGGSKHKSSARKHAANTVSRDPVPSSPYEKIATVDRMLGNGMCLIITHEPKPNTLICHIRGKFRGKQKSQNIVSNKSIVLIGLRDWEPIPKNCDLLAICAGNQGFPACPILPVDSDVVFTDDSDVIFTHDAGNLGYHILPATHKPTLTDNDNDNDIDFDDI
jgi:hypothetical protein